MRNMGLILQDSGSDNAEACAFLILAAGIVGDPEEELAGFGFEALVGGPEGEILSMERDANFFRLAGKEEGFLESFQLFHRPSHGSGEVLDVKLRDCGSCALAGVFYCGGGGEGFFQYAG